MVLVPSSEEIVSEFEPNGTTGTISNLFVDFADLQFAAWNVGEQTLAEA